MAVKKKELVCFLNSFKQLLFSLYWQVIVDMRTNFWKTYNISL